MPSGMRQETRKKRVEIILVVEDDDSFRRLIVELLRSHCHADTREASTTEEAWYVLLGMAQRGIAPSIAILDMRLPDGNGLSLVPALKRMKSKVIMLSNYTEYANEADKRGADKYVLKEDFFRYIVQSLCKSFCLLVSYMIKLGV